MCKSVYLTTLTVYIFNEDSDTVVDSEKAGDPTTSIFTIQSRFAPSVGLYGKTKKLKEEATHKRQSAVLQFSTSLLAICYYSLNFKLFKLFFFFAS